MDILKQNYNESEIINSTNLSFKLILFTNIKIIAIIIQLIGILLNLFVLHGLLNVKLGSRFTTLLLCNQCIFDCLICIFALLKILKLERWYTGYIIIDSILCYLWFSHTLFWLVVLLSLSNMMCTALDRLGAVVYSRTYQSRQNIYIVLAYTGILVYSFALIAINPLLLQYHDQKCYDTILYDKNWIYVLIKVDSILWPCLTYLFPCILTVSIYGKVITVLGGSTCYHQSSVNSYNLTNNNCTRVVSSHKLTISYAKQKRHRKIAHSLTIATCIMQTIFLITHSYDRIYYFLGTYQWLVYQIDCTTHLIGLWLVTLNSCISPTTLIFIVHPLQMYLLQIINKCCCKYSKQSNEPTYLNEQSEICLSRTEFENKSN
ncbi:amine GPCR [Schistosoma japonicum]|uniref:Amine GPCR n=1 Tax=Schistosoma japonicum TaxID=6182 RepID=A0A4Z2CR59_SCHJA|nr:amine GPCR [Schistosoma japonicum]